MNEDAMRPSPESVLTKLSDNERGKLRIYIGAAPGVGKTYQMLEDAHELKRQSVDVVIGIVDPRGREETANLIGDLERVPLRCIASPAKAIDEMDLEAVIKRSPDVVLVDDLAHTNVAGSKNRKRYQDVLELLSESISVFTAVNIQHLESLSDVVFRTTGVRVRETFPDWFLECADDLVDVDVSVETLRTRLRQGKIYGVEKIEQSLNNFFRQGNLSMLRELAARQAQAHPGRTQRYEPPDVMERVVVPDRVIDVASFQEQAKEVPRIKSRIATLFQRAIRRRV